MAIPATQNAVISAVAANGIGKASGTFNMLRQLGGGFGVAILVAVFAGVGSFGSPQAFSNGYAAAIGVSVVLSLVGAITGMALLGGRERALMRTKAKVPETKETENQPLVHVPALLFCLSVYTGYPPQTLHEQVEQKNIELLWPAVAYDSHLWLRLLPYPLLFPTL